MDDLVVIILTILVAVVGALSRKKKKREANLPPVDGPQKTSQPMDLWDMIMQEENETQPIEEQEYAKVEMEKPEPEETLDSVPKKPNYSFSPSVEGQSDIEGVLKKSLKPKSKKVYVDGEKFSLRKAVIYNEILRRKYT